MLIFQQLFYVMMPSGANIIHILEWYDITEWIGKDVEGSGRGPI
jgi:hypothetical protein